MSNNVIVSSNMYIVFIFSVENNDFYIYLKLTGASLKMRNHSGPTDAGSLSHTMIHPYKTFRFEEKKL